MCFLCLHSRPIDVVELKLEAIVHSFSSVLSPIRALCAIAHYMNFQCPLSSDIKYEHLSTIKNDGKIRSNLRYACSMWPSCHCTKKPNPSFACIISHNFFVPFFPPGTMCYFIAGRSISNDSLYQTWYKFGIFFDFFLHFCGKNRLEFDVREKKSRYLAFLFLSRGWELEK